MNKNVIVFGSGSTSIQTIKILKEQRFCISAVFDRTPRDEWHGFQVKAEDTLGKYLADNAEDLSVVIASQYFTSIYSRLAAKGIELPECYGLNLYKQTTPYRSGSVIPFSDDKFRRLETFLEDDVSKNILHQIIKNRGNAKAPEFIPAQEMQEYEGYEDYWSSIATHRRYKKAIIIDGGAYTGDTINPLCHAVGQGIRAYYAFEPMVSVQTELTAHATEVQDRVEQFNIVSKGLWSSDTDLWFQSEEFTDASHFSDELSPNCEKVSVQRLDSMDLEPDADIFIKMDIEGSELEALRGAENLIRTRKPSLAICVYHKENDIVDIPLYLKSLVPEYRLYLCGGSHTICIAQIEKS